MSNEKRFLMPGPASLAMADAPPLIPMCATCELPVELMAFHDITDPFRLRVEIECHGAHAVLNLSIQDVIRYTSGGERLVVFRPKGRRTLFRY